MGVELGINVDKRMEREGVLTIIGIDGNPVHYYPLSSLDESKDLVLKHRMKRVEIITQFSKNYPDFFYVICIDNQNKDDWKYLAFWSEKKPDLAELKAKLDKWGWVGR